MKVLVVDDQVLFRECLVKAIDSQPDFRIIGQTSSVDEGIELSLNLQPDVVVMGTESSFLYELEAMETILFHRPMTKIVILATKESDNSLFAAIRHGAKGYLPKDIPLEHLLASLRALGRDEAAISRTMTSRIIQEFSRLGKLSNGGKNTGLDNLTTREIEILGLLGRDASNFDIAEYLKISTNTVKVHISHILDKLNLNNRHEAGRFARWHGITSNGFKTSNTMSK